MCRSHPSASGIAQQHRQTIGHHDGASYIRGGRKTCIGLEAIRHSEIQLRTVHPVDLLQEHGTTPNDFLQLRAIGTNSGRLISNMIAQIHAVIRRKRNATVTIGHDGTHMVGRWPFGLQPIQ
jgi:hypothetical protein